MQLFAGDPDTLSKGAETAWRRGHCFVRRHKYGLPMPKVLKKGREPASWRTLTTLFHGEGPYRFGFLYGRRYANVLPVPPDHGGFCRGLLEGRRFLVCLHGRTPAQRYAGEADRDIVARMAEMSRENMRKR